MTNHWVLQGNLKKWDDPDRFYAEAITGWSVRGIEEKIAVGDGVLIWMAGKVAGEPRFGFPLGWGDDKARATLTPFAPFSISWYLMHNPVSVDRLRTSAFAGNLIMSMPRRTAYACTSAEFDEALELMQQNGPTSLPIRPGPSADDWWRAI